MTQVETLGIFTTDDGRHFIPMVIPQGSPLDKTTSPCELCDLRKECDVGRCKAWRELATLSLTCMAKTYFKEIR